MMFVLTIKSLNSPEVMQVDLRPSESISLGRSTKVALAIPWDPAISREHAILTVNEQTLHLQCLPTARNPAVFNGQPVHQVTLQLDQEFRIGTTNFRFELSQPTPSSGKVGFGSYQVDAGSSVVNFDVIDDSPDADLLERHSYSPGELSHFTFDKADERIEMLANLPRLIANSNTDEELALSLAGLLLRAIPKATAVAVAHFSMDELPDENDNLATFPKPLMLRIETHSSFDGTFRPSRRLILRALSTRQSVMQIWHGSAGAANFTLSDGLGWAIVIPIPGQSCTGWCLYVSGAGSEGTVIVTQKSLIGDLRCAELIAQFIGSIRQVRLLEGQKTRMSSFFSPRIIDSLTNATTSSAMSPIEREVAILFCDVRNFSQKSEELRHDLLTLLKSVSTALGTMTDGILDFDGTIADFQGDAALGFWGWPVENPNGPLPACLAALQILERFENPAGKDSSLLLNGFSIGMGIAFGRALAGEIGTTRQSKLGVFGPVVNSGSRLQGLSKKFGVSICIDEATAYFVRNQISKDVAFTRRLGNVIPRGMTTPVNVYSLEPARTNRSSDTDSAVFESFELALDSVQSGDWKTAVNILRDLPNSDGPTRFLKQFIEDQGMHPPSGWSGTIEFESK